MSLPERIATQPDHPAIFEDRALYRTGLVMISVEATPERRRSPRGDLILRGYVAGKEIELVFPGRRHAAAVQLLHRLQQLVQKASSEGTANGGGVRLPIRIEGAWRIRLRSQPDGMPDRRFQLIAARWRFRSADGIDWLHGELPVG